jgi:hypothetical protein
MNDALAYLLVAAGLVALAFRLGGRSSSTPTIGPASEPPISLMPKGGFMLRGQAPTWEARLTRGGRS